jgi:hypothetical protein
MVFAAVRVAVTSSDGERVHPEITWLALWSATESSVAVSVACMPSFRVLFTQLRAGASLRGRSGPSTEQWYGRFKGSAKISSGSKKGWRSSTKDLEDSDMELNKFGAPHIVQTKCVAAEEHSRSVSSMHEANWPERSSVDGVLWNESIRVQRTWRVRM